MVLRNKVVNVMVQLFESSKPQHLIDLLGCVKALKDEVTLRFTDYGIEVLEMDDSHISMIDFKLPMDFFDQYAEDYRGAIALNLEETLKVLGKLGKNDELTVSRDEATAKLYIKLRGHKSLTRYKSIPTL